jgi:hypothetical protein
MAHSHHADPNHPAHGRHVHLLLCVLVVIELAVAALIFADITPHQQLPGRNSGPQTTSLK